MKILKKVLAVVCAFTVTGTMVLPGSMVNSITYAEDNKNKLSADGKADENNLVIGSDRTDLNIIDGDFFQLNAYTGSGKDTYESDIKFEYNDSEFEKVQDHYSEEYSKITLKALKPGNFAVTVKDEVSGAFKTVPITVGAKSGNSYSLFDMPIINKDQKTNFAHNGLYVEALKYDPKTDKQGNNYYNSSFEVYNERASYGIVEVYNEKGELISTKLLAPAKALSTDTWIDTLGGLTNLGGDILFTAKTGDWLSYRQQAGKSGHTSVKLTNIPKGASIKITNDPLDSDVLFMVGAADIIMEWYGVYKKAGGSAATVRDKFNNAAMREFAEQLKSDSISVNSSVNSIKDKLADNDLSPESLTEIITSDAVIKALEDVLLNIDYSKVSMGYAKNDVKNALQKASELPNEIKTIGETAFTKNGAVNFYKTVCAFTNSSDGGAVSISVPKNAKLSSDNVSVSGEFDEDTSLEAKPIDFDENIKKCLPSSLSEIPSDLAFVYDISLYHNGAAVQPGGDITVSIAIPDKLKPYAEHLRVYRIEADDTASLLETSVADGIISFVTGHLSEYVLIPSQASGTITIPDNVLVTNSNEKFLHNGDAINTGDVLQIKAITPKGQKLVSLTVNGTEIENDSEYTVDSMNVVIAVEFEGAANSLTIIIPQNVTVTRNDIYLSNGAKISSDDVLRITATAPEGKKLKSLTVNGTNIQSGSSYTVGTDNVVIAVAFEDAPPADNFTVSIPQNVTVTRNNSLLGNGAKINTGDVLRISATAPNGKKIKSLTVNGKEITNNSSYTVGNENVVIAVTFEDVPPSDKLKVTIPQNVTVTRNNVLLGSGAEIHNGDILHISAVAPSGKKLKSLTVNGTQINNNSSFIVGSKDVVIEVTFENTTAADNLKITIPDNVTVSVGNIAELKNGDTISKGEMLLISATPPKGKKLKSLTVNGTPISNNTLYFVGDKNVVIAVSFEDDNTANLSITIPQNVTVTKGGAAVKNGDKVSQGDSLRITATAPNGKKLKSLSVNGSALKSGSLYTVGDKNVVIKVEFEDDKTAAKYRVTIPSGVTVKRGGSTLKNGDGINEGDVLKITANVPNGYKIHTLTVNGTSIDTGDEYKVQKENVVINISYEKLSDGEKQPFIITDSGTVGWDNILNKLDESPNRSIMVDMNGTSIVPANILRTAKNSNINLILKMNDQISWSIDSNDIKNTDRDIDFQVFTNTNAISEDSIKKFIGDRDHTTLSTRHNGDLGLTAYLVIDVGEKYNDEPATLYWYNNDTFSKEDSCNVQYGKAVLKFTHASDWLIAFGKTSSRPTNRPDDTSDPIDVKPNDPKPDDSNSDKPTTSDPDDSGHKTDNPDTGTSRVTLGTFLALIASAATCLFAGKKKR